MEEEAGCWRLLHGPRLVIDHQPSSREVEKGEAITFVWAAQRQRLQLGFRGTLRVLTWSLFREPHPQRTELSRLLWDLWELEDSFASAVGGLKAWISFLSEEVSRGARWSDCHQLREEV